MLLPVLATLSVIVLPGYALVYILTDPSELSLVERVCVAIGVSLSIVPLLLLFFTSLGVPFGPLGIVGLVALSGVAVVINSVRRQRRLQNALTFKMELSFEEILLLVTFLFTLFFRLWVVREQSFPLWTDGYHHTLISQLVRDTGFVPESYRPYAPIDRFTYHFGFHSIVASWAWLTGLSTHKSTLIVAQIINSLVVPTLYIFARTITGRKDIGLIASMIAGLVSIMPAYYVNWSRNTQLAGQTILPAALVALVQILEAETGRRRWSLLAAILLAGLFLTHYRVWIFALLFVLTYLAFRLPKMGLRQPTWAKLGWFIASLLVAAVLTAPWAWRILGEFLVPKHLTVDSGAIAIAKSETYRIYFAPSPVAWLLDRVITPVQLLVAFLGSLYGMLYQRRVILILLSWLGLEFLVATPAWTGLPERLVPFNSFAVAIALYLVTSILSAIFIAYVIDRVSAHWRPIRALLLTAVLLFTCIFAASWQPFLLDPAQVLVTRADEAAMIWVTNHTPTDATFAIRPLFQMPASITGLDGGYWLPYLTGRQTLIPPMTYASDGNDSYVAEVISLSRAITEVETPAAFASLLRAHRVSYVYIGPRESDFRRQVLIDSSEFETLYDQDGAAVFRVR